MIDVFDTSTVEPKIDLKEIETPTKWEVDPKSTTSLVLPEEEIVIKKFFEEHPKLRTPKLDITIKDIIVKSENPFEEGIDKFDPNEPWIQTFSGRRFNPTKPVVDAIVIQDIAHSLSMLCRFTGHSRHFYSVAQHSVLVSYVCDEADALWGLLHDSTECYLQDLPRPLKHSGKFESYIEMEKQMQLAVCKRFGLSEKEPTSVKKADILLLATEARDLMSPLHPDWKQPVEPLPFKIDPWNHDKAEDMFTKRFYELWGFTGAYEHYLECKYGDQK